MKLLIDLTSLADNNTGIENYAAEISRAVVAEYAENVDITLVFKDLIDSRFAKLDSRVKCVVLKGGRSKLIFNQLILPLALYLLPSKYYYFPAFSSPFLFFSRNVVDTIHDISYWDLRGVNRWYMTLYFRVLSIKSVMSSRLIVAVSEFTKSRVKRRFRVKEARLAVIPASLRTELVNFEVSDEIGYKVKKELNLPDDYILSLGTIEPRKNLSLLLEAYCNAVERNSTVPDLVVAGRYGWKMENLLTNVPRSVRRKIHFTGFVADDSLPYLYKLARFFVFPSKYEGFGIPPIEALSVGTAVLASKCTAMPDVLAEHAFYFESDNSCDLESWILNLSQGNYLAEHFNSTAAIKHARTYAPSNNALLLIDLLAKNG